MLERSGRATKRNRKLRPPTPSKQTEVWYRRQLDELIKYLRDIALDEFNNTILNDAELSDELRLQTSRKLARTIEKLSSLNIQGLARQLSTSMVVKANSQNKKQTIESYQAALGIDLTNLLGNDVVKQQLELAVENNINLIQSIKNDFITELGDKVRENLFAGGHFENVTRIIYERSDVSMSRARFIARDQAAKLNGDLTRIRAESLDLDYYEWGGAGDERQRKDHTVLNGMLCKWSDRTVYSGDGGKTWKKRSLIGGVELHPGEDYQCRCTAIPYVKLD